MAEQLFKCGFCDELTPLIMRKDKLGEGIQHNYAECKHCKGKVTHSYTNKRIRGLMVRQQHTKQGKKKVELAELILKEMEELKEAYHEKIID